MCTHAREKSLNNLGLAERIMAEIDRARLIEIATAIRRAARQPVLIELCDGVTA